MNSRITRIGGDLLTNWDSYLVVAAGVVTLGLGMLHRVDTSVIPPLLLTMIGVIALSIRRDRGIDKRMERSLSDIRFAVDTLTRNRTFEQQCDAYDYLTREVVDGGQIKHAIIIQYSSMTVLNLVRTLLRKGATVTLYVQREDVAAKIGSQFQARRIREAVVGMRGNLGKLSLEQKARLEIRQYRSPASVSAVKLDDRVLCMGWYIYESDGETHPGDTVTVSGHDVAAVVAWSHTEQFRELDKTFAMIESNYRETAEPAAFLPPSDPDRADPAA